MSSYKGIGYVLIFMGIVGVVFILLHSFDLLGETIETYYKFAGFFLLYSICFFGGYILLALVADARSKKKYARSAASILFIIGIISGLISLGDTLKLYSIAGPGSLSFLSFVSFIASIIAFIIGENL